MALLTTKEKIGIGTWNVRTLYQEGNLEILLNQMEKFDWEVLGISETHWTDHRGIRFYAQVTIQPTGQE